MVTRLIKYLIMSLAVQAAAHDIALSQEFRIETEIYQGAESDPVSESLTLFAGGLIYDFLLVDSDETKAEQVAIFDTHQRKFILLDAARKIKATVPEHQLIRFLNALKSDGMVRNEFLVNPEFQENYDTASGSLVLSSDQMTYETAGKKPTDGTVLPIYYEFIDQFARLNATDPRRMPPFARLKLNTAIKKYGFIPDEVKLSLAISEGDSKHRVELKSKHHVIWELSSQDRETIELAKEYWITFRDVTLQDFRGLSKSAADASKDE